MQDATYILKKHRVYRCEHCGAECCRPLQASDTRARPFPVPCERCGKDLRTSPYEIVDSRLYFAGIYLFGEE